MALSDPRTIFGIHSVAPYNRSTGEFYGIAKVLDSSSVNISQELIELTGGSQKYPWAVESGLASVEVSLSIGQYDNFLMQLAYGKTPTDNAAEATGSVTTLTNKYGTSIVDASNGIDVVEITAGDSADLKFGKYVIKAVGADTFDVYVSSDVDFAAGTDGSYVNDLLKITSSPLDVSSADAVMADWGLTFSKVGTPAFTVGDTATFSVRPPNSDSMDVTIGGASDVVPEIGLLVYAQKRGDNSMFELDLFRVKLSALPLGFSKNEWSVAEITAKAFYDTSRDGVMSIRHIIPS